jgi:hypothetical protein
VASRPEWDRIFPAVEKISRKRPHVGAGQKDVTVRLERALVGGEHRGTVAAGEADAGLGAGVGRPAGGELPRHRAGEASHFVDIDIGQHPGPPSRDRELVVIDDDERLEALQLVRKLDDAHGLEPTPGAAA